MDLIAFMFQACLAGCLAGLAAVGGLLALDVGSLGTLVFGPAGGVVPLVLLAAGFMITFGSAAIGAAVMSLGEEDG
jgi:hypothetical protein